MNPNSSYCYPCMYGDPQITRRDTTALTHSNMSCDGGQVRNLANSTVTTTMRNIQTGATVLTKTNTYSASVDNIIFQLESGETDLPGGRYEYDIVVVDQYGVRTTLDKCRIFICEGVTP